MNKLDYIDLFNGLRMEPTPLYFEQKLTTAEFLLALQKRVNDIIDMINTFGEEDRKYTDEIIASFREEIEERLKAISNDLRNEVLEGLNTSKLYTDNEIEMLKKSVNSKLTIEKEERVTTDSDLLKRIKSNYDDLLKRIIATGGEIFDPTTGDYASVSVVIAHVFDSMRNNVYTAGELDNKLLTATQLDAFEYTATLFDNGSKTIF